MGKRRKPSKRYEEGSGKRSRVEEEEEAPDPESRSFYLDEVDEFHEQRDQMSLSGVPERSSQPHMDNEVFRIRPESESDEEDEEEEIQQDEEDVDSDLDDEKEGDYLPSAQAWGKKRSTFYNTDYVDEDYGGFSGSDVEEAEMEEVEALRLQQESLQDLTEKDYLVEFPTKTSEEQRWTPEGDKETESAQTLDFAAMSIEDKKRLLLSQSPEIQGLIEDLLKKRGEFDTRLRPVFDWLRKNGFENNPVSQSVRIRMEIYASYILNLEFYMFLQRSVRQNKSSLSSLRSHPVLQRISEWKKLADEADSEAMEPDLDALLDCLKKRQPPPLHPIEDQESFEPKNGKKKTKKMAKELVEVESEGEGGEEEEEEDGKRGITYEIAKNKGLRPARKKEQRNPRVANRRKYKKALIRRRSQMPDVVRELGKYGGELRGIKASIVRSTKFKS